MWQSLIRLIWHPFRLRMPMSSILVTWSGDGLHIASSVEHRTGSLLHCRAMLHWKWNTMQLQVSCMKTYKVIQSQASWSDRIVATSRGRTLRGKSHSKSQRRRTSGLKSKAIGCYARRMCSSTTHLEWYMHHYASTSTRCINKHKHVIVSAKRHHTSALSCEACSTQKCMFKIV